MQVFYLSVTSSNYPVTHIGLYPTITSSGIGNALFKLSDIYTGTFNAKNELIRGLADGKITLQNEATLSTHSATTDSLGQALFQDLTAGPYKCKITATAHQEQTSRVWIKPGITIGKEIFLEYNLVTVEWEVNEITIEDTYEILLKATFETDVPATGGGGRSPTASPAFCPLTRMKRIRPAAAATPTKNASLSPILIIVPTIS